MVGGATNYVSLAGSHTAPYGTWATAATNIQAAISAQTTAGGVVLVTPEMLGQVLHYVR